jgi:hypothetical protein
LIIPLKAVKPIIEALGFVTVFPVPMMDVRIKAAICKPINHYFGALQILRKLGDGTYGDV